MLGCDTGPGDDIWAISLDLDALIEEIAPQATPAWQRPDVLSHTTGSTALQLLADADGWLHATWVQAISEDDPQQGLYYSRWDGIGWSQPKALLSSPGGRDIVQPAITLSPDSKMMAVWVDGMPGNAYFSQAALARAGNGAEWSSPASLPMAGEFASEPIIVAGQNGVIYVAYALPLNEGRGVYLVRSDDGGESWTGPLDVFDGAAAGWPMVGRPQLALGSEGTVHLMWAKSSLPPISEPLSLYYSRSTDGGARWTEPVPVAESPGAWSAILASGRSAVHRFWLAEDNDIWHQFSGDGGISWGQPQHVSSSGDATPVAASLLDGAGRPWLLRVAGTRAEQGQIRSPNEIRNWVMSDGRWTEEEVLKFSGDGIGGLAAAATSGGDLDVMFSAQGADQEGVTLYRSRRQLALPQVQSTVVPTLPPTPRSTATSTPTPAPTATALTSFPIDSSEVRGLPIPIDTSNPLTGPLLGIIPAGVMVLIALFLGIRRVRGGGRR